MKNSLSVVQSIATQSFRGGRADPAALATFRGRLVALADANEVLLNQDWTGFGLRDLVDRIIEPYRDPHERIAVAGPDLEMPQRLNVPLALILHELSTNASKYGALSSETGNVDIVWDRDAASGALTIRWVERGGPQIAAPPARGFGLQLICEVLAVEVGAVKLTTDAAGLACEMRVKL